MKAIDAYSRWEPVVHAWECFHPERIEAARGSRFRGNDRESGNDGESGEPPLVVGIKDIINTADCPTQMGSDTWRGHTPGNDARVVSMLKAAGCIIAGKTVSAEFAVHHPGKTRNPHNLARTPGTSSSGSAAAVACGMVDAALGTQTGGSIIRPASWCGVYAMKPSFGLIPRTGILKTADTLDTVGFFAQTPELLRRMLDVCRVDGPDYPWTAGLTQPRPVRKIGLILPDCAYGWPIYATNALNAFIDEISGFTTLVTLGRFVSAYRAPWRLEGAYHTHRTIYHKSLSYYFKREAQTSAISDTFRAQVDEGRKISLEEYQQALADQTVFAATADAMLSDLDMIITLSSGGVAPENEADAPRDTNLVWTLCGVPVINIPAFTGPAGNGQQGLPFGMSIIARRYHDYKLLDFLDRLVATGLAPGCQNPCLTAPSGYKNAPGNYCYYKN